MELTPLDLLKFLILMAIGSLQKNFLQLLTVQLRALEEFLLLVHQMEEESQQTIHVREEVDTGIQKDVTSTNLKYRQTHKSSDSI